MGKGQRPRPLETPALDVLTWLAAAEHDLRAARQESPRNPGRFSRQAAGSGGAGD
jgi:hypothetical protein